MDVNKPRSVLATVQYGGVSEAALQLYLTQSSVSKNIQTVEKELGIRIFQKNGRHLELTPEGKKMLPYIETAVQSYETMLNMASKYAMGNQETITIISTPIRSGLPISGMIRKFQEAYPAFTVEVTESTESQSILEQLRRGNVDMAILVRTYISTYPCQTPFSALSSEFVTQPLLKDYYYAVIYDSHPLAKKEQISLRDFHDEPFIAVNNRFSAYHSMLEEAAQIYDIRFNITAHVDSISSVTEMVGSKMGISILSSRVVTPVSNVVLKPIQEDLFRETYLAIRNNGPKKELLGWFVDYARNNEELTSKRPRSDSR